MLQITEFSKSFTSQNTQVTALQNISFSLQPGNKTLLYGLNGSGKTTLLKCIAGLLIPDHGQGVLKDQPLHDNTVTSKKNICFVSSDINSMYPRLTIRENLEFFTFSYVNNAKKLRTSIDTFIHLFDIAQFSSTPFQNCSNGIKKRACLIKALIADREILLIDEWDTGIDIQTKQLFLRHMRGLSKILIFSSHTIPDQADFFNNLLILYQGNLIFTGTLPHILRTTNTVSLAAAIKLMLKFRE